MIINAGGDPLIAVGIRLASLPFCPGGHPGLRNDRHRAPAAPSSSDPHDAPEPGPPLKSAHRFPPSLTIAKSMVTEGPRVGSDLRRTREAT